MVVLGLAVLCLLLALLALGLDKVYFYLPAKELKFRADKGDTVSRTLYRAAAYGPELKLLLSLEAVILLAVGFVFLSLALPAVASIILIILIVSLALVYLPRSRISRPVVKLAVWCVPLVTQKLGWLHPGLQRLVARTPRRLSTNFTGLYERGDFIQLIDRQSSQRDNRIGEQELQLMRRALQFDDLKVQDAMVRREHVKAVSAEEEVGPIFLAELHDSGYVIFPVYEGKKTSIVGVLAIDAVANMKPHGKVRDCYDPHLAYVHEQDSLIRALRAFYETNQHLFIVINRQGEYVGIITLKDILHQLFGAIEREAFGHHDDKQAVARRHTNS